MAQVLLEARNINRIYQSGQQSAIVLDTVSVALDSSDFLIVTGPSGSGKSTLLNVLSGMDSPTSGEVVFQGRKMSAMNKIEIARIRNSEFGFIFQTPHLLPDKNVIENVILPFHYGDPVSMKFVVKRCEELLDYVGLADKSSSYPHTLSGGEMQRVVIARALARGPKVIFADEPTGNLDSANSEKVIELLQSQVATECGLVMVTHDTSLIACGNQHLELKKVRSLVSP